MECKHFFSWAALYAVGKINASLGPVGLGLKLPVEVMDQLIECGDAGGLGNIDKTPANKVYVLPPDIFVQNARRLANLLEIGI